ncbi:MULTISPECIES: hypothetical protein [Alkalihalobacterium]|uniref:YfhD family protein n=1 Tax=Alkalihalobacterium chitinilyticum TaxID=2980103 RepID=A0ABT5VJY2_9BACI|nr:hypothetical protein [Alkalihalobacterium chitinilyticum]MDE5415590.1 hypothetical protein [Alkalihalobacterium chitinilyticum]
MKNKQKELELQKRNKKSHAFKEDWDKQLERDQMIMPIDEPPLEDVKLEEQEERQKKKTKQHSSSQ